MRCLSADEHSPGCFLLHADLHGARILGENILKIRRLVAAAGADAVITFGEAPGIVVQLERAVSTHTQLMGYGSGFQGSWNRRSSHAVLVGHLELVVP